MITAFLVLVGGSAIGCWLGNWHASKWISKHKVGSKENKGCSDVFVCPVEDKPVDNGKSTPTLIPNEISQEELDSILKDGKETVRNRTVPTSNRKMAQIIKRKPVDPIDEIVNENGGSDAIL